MNRRCAAVGLSLLGLVAPGWAESAIGARPLQLKLPTPALVRDRAALASPASLGAGRPMAAANARANAPVQAEPSVRQRALQSLLVNSDQVFDEAGAPSAQSPAQFHFKRQGSALKNLSRGYRDMCDTVSAKVWDEPNGRRVRFDIAGKPGVAVEIPLH